MKQFLSFSTLFFPQKRHDKVYPPTNNKVYITPFEI